MPFDETQQMILGDLIVEPEVIEQSLRPGVLAHHQQQASEHSG
jgi:hypothetical protein